jgi:hypothetical protein
MRSQSTCQLPKNRYCSFFILSSPRPVARLRGLVSGSGAMKSGYGSAFWPTTWGPVAKADFSSRHLIQVSDQLAAAAGEDRRPVGKACPLLLAVVGREPSDAAPVRKHAAADSGFAATSRIGAAAMRNQSGQRRGVEGGVSEKSLRNGQIMAFWPGQRTRGAGRGLCRWNECEKGGEPDTQGCILSSPDKQNGNPRSKDTPPIARLGILNSYMNLE